MILKAKIKEGWAALLILAVAAATRLTLLGMKPPHFDEGVNGWFVDQITHTGFYHYDPTNYHGPFHFYVLFLAQTLLGRHIWALRLPLALMSLATVALTLRFDRFIGRAAALWAAAAMAVSPGCIFYGRYAIHEYWLVFSLMLCAWGLAGLWNGGERKYLWAVWIGLTGAVLTKETYVIHLAAFLLTVPCVWLLGVMSPACPASLDAGRQEPSPDHWTAVDMTLGALVFFGCVVLFYSGGFMDLPGLKGLYQTFKAWAHTGKSGHGHEKPWIYWMQLFGRYEWPSCLGSLAALSCAMPRTPRVLRELLLIGGGLALGYLGYPYFEEKVIHWSDVWPFLPMLGAFLAAVLCVAQPPRFIRALAIYGIGTLIAYSIIHYKTPWCVVSLTWPFLLLFGYGVDAAWRKCGTRIGRTGATLLVGGLAVLLLAGNLYFAVWLNFFHFTDAKQPYVYVQTFQSIDEVMNPLNALVARNPAESQISGHILMESYHPLPWLLGDFPNIDYYDDNTSPPKMDAGFLMVDDSRTDEVEKALREPYFTATLTLRDAQDPSKLYLNAKTFQSVFPGRKPDFIPGAKEVVPAPPADAK